MCSVPSLGDEKADRLLPKEMSPQDPPFLQSAFMPLSQEAAILSGYLVESLKG